MLVAPVAGVLVGEQVEESRRWILIADAIAISTFAIAGGLRTIDAGLSTWSVVLPGTITAVGGGVLCHIMSGETPMIFRRGELYAFASMGGCIGVVIANALDVPRALLIVVGYVACLNQRLGSFKFGWMSWAPRGLLQ